MVINLYLPFQYPAQTQLLHGLIEVVLEWHEIAAPEVFRNVGRFVEKFFHQSLEFSLGWRCWNMSLVSWCLQLICQVVLVQQNGVSNVQFRGKL